jgi:signal transduction histidine kinase
MPSTETPIPPAPYSEPPRATHTARAVAVDATLLANFTHQIVNPLSGVVGTIDNLIDGTIQGERRDQRLRAVRAQLVNAIELVRNLAYLSELSTEGGRDSLRAGAVDVCVPQVIIEAAQILQEMARKRNIEVRLKDSVTQYVVKAHAALLRQVFTNIIENGIKYSDENTEIQLDVRAQRSTKHLLIEIASFGPGFTPAERERIFELGFRGTDALSMRASGSGLGLFICDRIVSLYDAGIEAEYSPKSRETLFRIRFPSFSIDTERTQRIDDDRRGQEKRHT